MSARKNVRTFAAKLLIEKTKNLAHAFHPPHPLPFELPKAHLNGA
jgi:hypothetical protein